MAKIYRVIQIKLNQLVLRRFVYTRAVAYSQVTLRYACASGGRPMPLVGRHRYHPVSSRSALTITSAPSLPICARDMRPGTRRTSTPLRNHWCVMLAGLAAAWQSRRTREPSSPVVLRGATMMYAFAGPPTARTQHGQVTSQSQSTVTI